MSELFQITLIRVGAAFSEHQKAQISALVSKCVTPY